MPRRRRSRRPVQLELKPRTWGGRREGAGRKPTGKRHVPHRTRRAHVAREPVHLTLRCCAGAPNLRSGRVVPALAAAITRAHKDFFRVLHFSIQRTHVHLIVEASGTEALTRGAQGLAIRLARAANRAAGRRGNVFAERYHAHALATPSEVRRALVYVLQNARTHGERFDVAVDPCSSAPWFDGWRGWKPARGRCPVRAARTWLAGEGWRRLGLIDPRERPRAPG